jgi:hypothetical protein
LVRAALLVVNMAVKRREDDPRHNRHPKIRALLRRQLHALYSNNTAQVEVLRDKLREQRKKLDAK